MVRIIIGRQDQKQERKLYRYGDLENPIVHQLVMLR